MRTFASVVESLVPVVNTLIAVLGAVAVVIFFWGIVRYIFSTGSGEKANGRELMVWGIIALVVFTGLMGIIALIGNSLFP